MGIGTSDVKQGYSTKQHETQERRTRMTGKKKLSFGRLIKTPPGHSKAEIRIDDTVVGYITKFYLYIHGKHCGPFYETDHLFTMNFGRSIEGDTLSGIKRRILNEQEMQKETNIR